METALRTLLLFDLVDSTKLTTSLGDTRAAQLSAALDGRTRDLIAEHLGLEIDKTDGFLVLFELPLGAIRCALDYLEVLTKLSAEWGVELKARIGIEVGTVVIRQNPAEHVARGAKPVELDGLLKPKAARLMSLAGPNQILLGRTAFDLARRQAHGDVELPTDLEWHAHGPFRLKGVDEPVEVFEVGRPGTAPLAAPRDHDKATRIADADSAFLPGWRPAIGIEVPGATNWILNGKLGEGGFGEAWLAKNRHTREENVFKFCFHAEKIRSLKREFTIFRLLREALGDRDDIVRLIDLRFDAAPYFIQSEFTEGGDMRQWAAARGGLAAIPLRERLLLAAQVAGALHAAHSLGIVHKDVKPTNILVTSRGRNQPQARLADFGIGQLVESKRLIDYGVTATGMTEETAIPGEGSRTGTRLYMAPEVQRGLPASFASDTYSFGILLYQLVVGDFDRFPDVGWESGVDNDSLMLLVRRCLLGDPSSRPRMQEVGKKLVRFSGALGRIALIFTQWQSQLGRQAKPPVFYGLSGLLLFFLDIFSTGDNYGFVVNFYCRVAILGAVTFFYVLGLKDDKGDYADQFELLDLVAVTLLAWPFLFLISAIRLIDIKYLGRFLGKHLFPWWRAMAILLVCQVHDILFGMSNFYRSQGIFDIYVTAFMIFFMPCFFVTMIAQRQYHLKGLTSVRFYAQSLLTVVMFLMLFSNSLESHGGDDFTNSGWNRYGREQVHKIVARLENPAEALAIMVEESKGTLLSQQPQVTGGLNPNPFLLDFMDTLLRVGWEEQFAHLEAVHGSSWSDGRFFDGENRWPLLVATRPGWFEKDPKRYWNIYNFRDSASTASWNRLLAIEHSNAAMVGAPDFEEKAKAAMLESLERDYLACWSPSPISAWRHRAEMKRRIPLVIRVLQFRYGTSTTPWSREEMQLLAGEGVGEGNLWMGMIVMGGMLHLDEESLQQLARDIRHLCSSEGLKDFPRAEQKRLDEVLRQNPTLAENGSRESKKLEQVLDAILLPEAEYRSRHPWPYLQFDAHFEASIAETRAGKLLVRPISKVPPGTPLLDLTFLEEIQARKKAKSKAGRVP